MIMLLSLFLIGYCAGEDLSDAPRYLEAKIAVEKVANHLYDNILSMNGDIPPLNDSRRHYADLFYIILKEAELETTCLSPPYYENYQNHINKTAIEGLSNPQKVINETQKLIDDFNNKTKAIQAAIRDSCVPGVNCNALIEDMVQNKLLEQSEATALLVGRKAAKAYLKRHHEIVHESHKLNTLKYIIKGAQKLDHTVKKLARLLRILRPIPPASCNLK